ncbi:hypothetical protein [Streptomyces sp. NPDC002386]
MSDVTSGVFGLVGVAVGAATTFGGAVWQQRKQAQAQRQEIERQRNDAAMDAAAHTLLSIQDLFQEVPPRSSAERAEWARSVARNVDAARLPIAGISDNDLRRKMLKLVTILDNWEYSTRTAPTPWFMSEVCHFGITLLAAHRRGAPLPEPNEEVTLASSNVSDYLDHANEQRQAALAEERSADPP